MLHSNFISCNCDFSKFWCGLGEEFPTLSKRVFEVIIPFQNTYMCKAAFPQWLPWNKTSISINSQGWHESISVNQCSQNLRYCETSGKVSLSDWLVAIIVCHFSTEEKFKHGCVFLLPNVMPDCMKLFLEFQQPQPSTSYHFLKAVMLGCESTLLSFISETDKFGTSITLKMVPVSTKMYVSECKFTTSFQEKLLQALFLKSHALTL